MYGLIRFLISFMVVLGYVPGSTAMAAAMPAAHAIETVKEDRNKQSAFIACKYSEPHTVLGRRTLPSGGIDQPTPGGDFKTIYTYRIADSRIAVHCSKSAIFWMYARLLSVFNFPQLISLHPRHVYW